MSVLSVSPTDLSQLYGAPAVSSVSDVTPASGLVSAVGSGAVSSASDAESTSVSQKAKRLGQLKDLSQSDPAEFKKVTADIATQLQSAAQQAGGSQGSALSSLATKFQQASQTGSVSPLLPAKHHHGGHKGVAGRVASAYQSAGASSASSAPGTGSQADSIISSVLSQDTSANAASGVSATSNALRLPPPAVA